jgi:hypothetical protein
VVWRFQFDAQVRLRQLLLLAATDTAAMHKDSITRCRRSSSPRAIWGASAAVSRSSPYSNAASTCRPERNAPARSMFTKPCVQATNVRAAMNASARLRRAQPTLPGRGATRGWGPVKRMPLAGFLVYAAPRGGLRVPPLGEVRSIQADRNPRRAGRAVRTALPGHTPGSVAYHVAAVDAVFVGDAMTTRSDLTGEIGPRSAPFTFAPAQANASFERLAEVDAAGCCPGMDPRGPAAR